MSELEEIVAQVAGLAASEAARELPFLVVAIAQKEAVFINRQKIPVVSRGAKGQADYIGKQGFAVLLRAAAAFGEPVPVTSEHWSKRSPQWLRDLCDEINFPEQGEKTRCVTQNLERHSEAMSKILNTDHNKGELLSLRLNAGEIGILRAGEELLVGTQETKVRLELIAEAAQEIAVGYQSFQWAHDYDPVRQQLTFQVHRVPREVGDVFPADFEIDDSLFDCRRMVSNESHLGKTELEHLHPGGALVFDGVRSDDDAKRLLKQLQLCLVRLPPIRPSSSPQVSRAQTKPGGIFG